MNDLRKKIRLITVSVVLLGFIAKNILYFMILDATITNSRLPVSWLPFGTAWVYRIGCTMKDYYWAYFMFLIVLMVAFEKMAKSDRLKELVYLGIIIFVVVYESLMMGGYPVIYRHM